MMNEGELIVDEPVAAEAPTGSYQVFATKKLC
jgi:hypothetical protein